jgi:hypothetical protein
LYRDLRQTLLEQAGIQRTRSPWSQVNWHGARIAGSGLFVAEVGARAVRSSC